MQLSHVLKQGPIDSSAVFAILLGSVVAFFVGLWALRILLKTLHRAHLVYFSIYLWVVGLAVIVLYLLG